MLQAQDNDTPPAQLRDTLQTLSAVGGVATIAGTDYVSLPASVTLAAGEKTASLAARPLTGDLREPLETAEIAMHPGTEYALGRRKCHAVARQAVPC